MTVHTYILTLAIVAATALVADAQERSDAQAVSDRSQTRRELLNLIPSSGQSLAGFSNEAFTEPVEEILVASAETGIVDAILVKRGDEVTRDQSLVELDMSVLKAARRVAMSKASGKAKLTASEVEFTLKSKRYQKLAQLYQEGAGSPEEASKARAEAEVARQNVEAILETIDQSRLETEQIDAQIERRRIRSPIDGVVVDITRKEGEYISNSDPHIATVVSLKKLRVVFYLPTKLAVKYREGDRLKVLLTETGQKATATVEYVAPVTNADSGRVRVDVLLNNASGKYRSGVRCRIDMQVGN